MLSLDLWTIASASNGTQQHDNPRKQLRFKEALHLLRALPDPAARPGPDWQVQVVTALVEQIKTYIIPLTRLVSALGFEPEDAGTVADTVAFNSYADGGSGKHASSKSRRFYLSDNVFGIYWTWDPSSRSTKVFMYGMPGEGTRQMQQVWKRISTSPSSCFSSPFFVGTAALEAEISEMKRWIAGQSDGLVKLHIETGHHDYATLEQRDVDQSRLAEMSRDVCGFAINISTSVLCLQRLLKFADFLMEESEGLDAALEQRSSSTNAKWIEELQLSQSVVKSRARVWRRRADALLDEGETWKHKASILVQTVFTLTTQRDTGISIQIAQDSRTLAQKATRDSTSMKAIAAVTMCFLPSTFVAVRALEFQTLGSGRLTLLVVSLRHVDVRVASCPRAGTEQPILDILGSHDTSDGVGDCHLVAVDQQTGIAREVPGVVRESGAGEGEGRACSGIAQYIESIRQWHKSVAVICPKRFTTNTMSCILRNVLTYPKWWRTARARSGNIVREGAPSLAASKAGAGAGGPLVPSTFSQRRFVFNMEHPTFRRCGHEFLARVELYCVAPHSYG